jgi:protein SCO1/2
MILALAAGPALVEGQTASDPHAAHRQQSNAPVPATRTPRLMPAQPYIADVNLVDQDGRATSLQEVLDTELPVLVNFIFTTCTTVCPIMTTGFSQFQNVLGPERDRVRLISISIDPDNDSVAALRAYAERYHAGRSWRLLTGTREASIAAQRSFGAYRGDKMNHAPATYVRRSPGEPWLVLDGLSNAQTLRRVWRGLSAAAN